MKLLSSGSYNIAWFKLADFVSRGEKERALMMYKLLMHSIQDEAFAHQLEGDILLSFHDYKAIDCYMLAANIYKQHGDYYKAIAVCEQSVVIKEDIGQLAMLLDLYTLIADQTKILYTFYRYALLAITTKKFGYVLERLVFYEQTHHDLFMAELYGYTFFALLLHDQHNQVIEEYLFKALQLYIQHEKHCQLSKFMAKLKVSHEIFYEKAQNFLLEK